MRGNSTFFIKKSVYALVVIIYLGFRQFFNSQHGKNLTANEIICSSQCGTEMESFKLALCEIFIKFQYNYVTFCDNFV